MKKLWLLVVVALCLVLPCLAEDVPTASDSQDYKYILLADGTAKIWRYSGHADTLVIPAEIDGYSVTSIGEGVFAFRKNLTCITIPDTVIHIDGNPFAGCSDLTDIRVSPDHPVFAAIDGVLFNKSEKELVFFSPALCDSTYTIPQDILSIGKQAFLLCDNLTDITIPNGVTSIGDSAFDSCANLTGITIPDSVTSIGNGAFAYCESLTDITIPDGVTSIGDSAFFFCESLTGITIPDSVTSIGDKAFYSCESLTGITIPDSVTFIGNGAFAYCESLTGITVPRDSYAAQYCQDNNLPYTYTYTNAND